MFSNIYILPRPQYGPTQVIHLSACLSLHNIMLNIFSKYYSLVWRAKDKYMKYLKGDWWWFTCVRVYRGQGLSIPCIVKKPYSFTSWLMSIYSGIPRCATPPQTRVPNDQKNQTSRTSACINTVCWCIRQIMLSLSYDKLNIILQFYKCSIMDQCNQEALMK